MSEKVAAHSGVTRHQESNTPTSANNPGRVIANRVFVGNIPSNLVERDLLMLFNRFGKIRDVKIIPEHSRNKSYGFVTFFSESDARRAIQASLQHDSVMWGDRKLNVAPAIKKSSTAPIQTTTTASTLYQGSRIASNSFYTAPVQVPTTLYSNPAINVSTPELSQQQPPAVDPVSVDVTANGLYQAAVICRLPHQYAVPQCQYPTTPNGHYYLTPGFQPYMQTATTPMPTSHPTQCGIAPYPPAMQPMPLTPPGSNTSRDNSMVMMDGQSDSCCDSGGSGGDSSASSQGGGEKSVVDPSVTEGTADVGQHHHQGTPTAIGDAPYPFHAAYMCCPHHSCVLSPISPLPHLAGQPAPGAGLARSCLSLHGHPGTGCTFPPNSPLIYSSPMMYNTGRRPGAARLQRWSSLDANLAALSHNHHQQMGMWGSESAWSRPSLLDDTYGSETGLYPTPRNFDRPLRPAFSCQSHHGGMLSPFCRSVEYNIWGQALLPNTGMVEQGEQAMSSSPHVLQMAPSPSHSSMSLNLSEVNNNDQIKQSKK